MSDPATGPDTPRVVSVEDNPGDIRLIEAGVTAADSDIHLDQYDTGPRALAALTGAERGESDHPDLVMLDMNLPGLSGLEILQRIRAEYPADTLPVVVVSSLANPDDINRIYEASANSYIKKPTDPDEFIRRIAGAVRFWVTGADGDY